MAPKALLTVFCIVLIWFLEVSCVLDKSDDDGVVPPSLKCGWDTSSAEDSESLHFLVETTRWSSSDDTVQHESDLTLAQNKKKKSPKSTTSVAQASTSASTNLSLPVSSYVYDRYVNSTKCREELISEHNVPFLEVRCWMDKTDNEVVPPSLKCEWDTSSAEDSESLHSLLETTRWSSSDDTVPHESDLTLAQNKKKKNIDAYLASEARIPSVKRKLSFLQIEKSLKDKCKCGKDCITISVQWQLLET